MNAKQALWTEPLTITASMVNHNRICRMDAICNIWQEVAGRHAHALGLGYYHLQAEGLFWALSRLRMQWYAFPIWQDKLEIRTWIHQMRGPLSYRNFSLVNTKTQTEVASASTLWTAVSRSERKPVRRLPFTDFPVLPDRPPTCGEPARIQIPGPMAKETTYQIRFSDLDMIGHVNNVRYVTWLLDSYGSYNLDHQPVALDMNYLSETTLSDSVVIQKFNDDADESQFRHSITHAGSNREVIRAAIRWA